MRDLFCPQQYERHPGLPFVLSMFLHLAAIPLIVLIGHPFMTAAPRAAVRRASSVVTLISVSMKRPDPPPRNTRPVEHRASNTIVPSPAPPAQVRNTAVGDFDLPTLSRREQTPAQLLTGGFDLDISARPDIGNANTGGTVGPMNSFDSGTSAIAPPARTVEDQPAELLGTPAPLFTDEARRHRASGKVVLKVRLCANGDVEVLEIIAGLDFGLSQAAVDAVNKLRCRPAKRAGVPYAVTGRIVVTFALT